MQLLVTVDARKIDSGDYSQLSTEEFPNQAKPSWDLPEAWTSAEQDLGTNIDLTSFRWIVTVTSGRYGNWTAATSFQ